MKKFICLCLSIAILSCVSSCENIQSPQNAAGDEIKATPTAAETDSQRFDIDSLSNKKMCWGQGYNVNSENQPLSCVEYNEKFGKFGGMFLNGSGKKTGGKNIVLTFDEGYENGFTSAILDTLKKKKVAAVFFVTYDYVKKNPDLVKRMIAEGHTVGNHSWSHPSMPDLSKDQAKAEISKLHDFVKEQFGYSMKYFRPPMGEFSERTLAIASELGYKSVLWSFAYKDYDVNNQPDRSAAMKRITSSAHSDAIYLLHAVSKTNTVILGDVIDNLREQGYKFSLLTS